MNSPLCLMEKNNKLLFTKNKSYYHENKKNEKSNDFTKPGYF